MARDGHARDVYRATCSCGEVVVEREADASNLPRESNRSIADSAAGAHEFTHEWKGEDETVQREWWYHEE